MNKPVAYMYDFPNPDDPTEIIKDWTAYSLDEVARNKGVNVRPLYLSPPQREWVGLTDEELIDAADAAPYHTMVTAGDYIYILARAVEQALKEKNK